MPSLTPIPIPITGGVDVVTSEDSLQPGMVSDGCNFLFENGRARTRPGVAPANVANLIGRVVYAKSYPRVGSQWNDGAKILITDNARMWQSQSVGSPPSLVTEVTASGGAIVLSAPFGVPINSDSVNGIILISTGATGGIFRWVPGAGTYSQIAAAPYGFVSSQGGKAIAAFRTDAVTFTAGVTFAWSATGDETNWSTNDSGSTQIADASTAITGLGVLSNVVVLLRYDGIHLATTTGVAPPVGPVYRVDPFLRSGRVGCFYPPTATFAHDFCIFVGQDNVYKFDLQQVAPIGNAIRDALFRAFNVLYGSGNRIGYVGFLAQDSVIQVGAGGIVNPRPRYRYHLLPAASTAFPGQAGINDTTLPHFVYNIEEDKWSIHRYNFNIYTAFAGLQPVLFDDSTPSKVYAWDNTLPQEAGAFLLGGVFTIEDLEKNFKVLQALLKYRDFGQSSAVRVTVTCMNGDTVNSGSDVQIVGTPEATLRWMRQYFSINIVGQLFQWRIDVDPNVEFETNYLSLRYGTAGEFRTLVGVGSDQNSGTSF